MKRLFLFIILGMCNRPAQAKNYYVDPSSVSTAEDGSYATPWKKLAAVTSNMDMFRAGDTVFFKRGERFVGKLNITCSGNASSPIVFMAYGNSISRPLFQYALPDPGLESNRTVITIKQREFIVLDGLKITDTSIDSNDHTLLTNIGYGVSLEKSNHITLKNLDISLVGIGVEITGIANEVSNCDIRNLRMVRNTPVNERDDDDYGAVALVIGGGKNVIRNNLFVDCYATSYDYGFDGGAIEIYGEEMSENVISNNIVINCNGFMELASSSGSGSCNNMIVENNFLVNNGILFYIHSGGKRRIAINNLQCLNNKVIETVAQFTKSTFLLSMGPDHPTTRNIINMRKNIFWLATHINMTPEGSTFFNDGQLVHEDNLYYMGGGKISYQLNNTESVFGCDSLLFRRTPPGLNTLLREIYEFVKQFNKFIRH